MPDAEYGGGSYNSGYGSAATKDTSKTTTKTSTTSDRGTTGMQQGTNNFNTQKSNEGVKTSTNNNQSGSFSGVGDRAGETRDTDNSSMETRDGGIRDMVGANIRASFDTDDSFSSRDLAGMLDGMDKKETQYGRATNIPELGGLWKGMNTYSIDDMDKRIAAQQTLLGRSMDLMDDYGATYTYQDAPNIKSRAGVDPFTATPTFHWTGSEEPAERIGIGKGYGYGTTIDMDGNVVENQAFNPDGTIPGTNHAYGKNEGTLGIANIGIHPNAAQINAARALGEKPYGAKPATSHGYLAGDLVLNGERKLPGSSIRDVQEGKALASAYNGALDGDDFVTAAYAPPPKKANVYDTVKPLAAAGLAKIGDLGEAAMEKIDSLFSGPVPKPMPKPTVPNLGATRADPSYYGDFKAPTQDFTSPEQEAELDRIAGVVNRTKAPVDSSSYYGDLKAPTQDFTSPEHEAELDRISAELNRRANKSYFGDFKAPTQDFTSPEQEAELDRIAERVNRPAAPDRIAAGTLTTPYDAKAPEEARADLGMAPFSNLLGKVPREAQAAPPNYASDMGRYGVEGLSHVADYNPEGGFEDSDYPNGIVSEAPDSGPMTVDELADWAPPPTRSLPHPQRQPTVVADRPRALGVDAYHDPDGIQSYRDDADIDPASQQENVDIGESLDIGDVYARPEPDAPRDPEYEKDWAEYNNKMKSKVSSVEPKRTMGATATKVVINGILSKVPFAGQANAIAGIFGKSAGDFVAKDMDRWNAMNPDQKAAAIQSIKDRESARLGERTINNHAPEMALRGNEGPRGDGGGGPGGGGGGGDDDVDDGDGSSGYTPRTFNGYPLDFENYGYGAEHQFYAGGGGVKDEQVITDNTYVPPTFLGLPSSFENYGQGPQHTFFGSGAAAQPPVGAPPVPLVQPPEPTGFGGRRGPPVRTAPIHRRRGF